jgi:hypothetical protein
MARWAPGSRIAGADRRLPGRRRILHQAGVVDGVMCPQLRRTCRPSHQRRIHRRATPPQREASAPREIDTPPGGGGFTQSPSGAQPYPTRTSAPDPEAAGSEMRANRGTVADRRAVRHHRQRPASFVVLRWPLLRVTRGGRLTLGAGPAIGWNPGSGQSTTGVGPRPETIRGRPGRPDRPLRNHHLRVSCRLAG